VTKQEACDLIWNYMTMRDKLRKADVIMVPCSYDLRVAEYAAELYLAGWAPRVLVSGGGFATEVSAKMWGRPEAEVFADAIKQRGVPEDMLDLETRAMNTGQNAQFSQELWESQGVDPKRVIVVQKPYAARRNYATFRLWWPKRELIMASPPGSFSDWMRNNPVPEDTTINTMVGDLWRVRYYPDSGFQIRQEIPDKVWKAHDVLVGMGYGRPERPGPKTRPAV